MRYKLTAAHRLSGFEPFYAEEEEEMFERIIACDYEFMAPFWDHISSNAKVCRFTSLVLFVIRIAHSFYSIEGSDK